jgi:putative DNA primase/helicase
VDNKPLLYTLNDNYCIKELRQYHQFVVTLSDKIPLNPRSGQHASVSDPSTWGTLGDTLWVDDCPQYVRGFVLTDRDPFVCLDLDSYKTNNPVIIAKHEEIKATFANTYQEKSPNGGTHIWCRGSLPSGRRWNEYLVEAYPLSRYITITGNASNNVPIADCQQQLNALMAQFPTDKPNAAPMPDQAETLTDEEIIKSCIQAGTGDKFKELWEGRWQSIYPSQSEADLVLCNYIAFWTDNKTQCGRIFRKSALGQRDKAKRSDYLFRDRYGIVTKAFDLKLKPIDFSSSDPTKKQQQQPTIQKGASVEIMLCSNVKPENIEWLWESWLPMGKLILIVGKANAGKSTLAYWMASIISSGGKWPDGTQCKQGNVLIWTSEDTAGDTIVPRLIAMGADCNKIGLIKSAVDATGKRMRFDPAKHIPLLREYMETNRGVKLVIIDPVVSVVEGDMNTANNVRGGLDVLPALAEAWNCCVVGLTHFKKGSEGKLLMDRVIGSQAFHALPRVVLAVGKDTQTLRRVLCFAKKNVAEESGGGYEFGITGAEFEFKGEIIKTSKIEMVSTPLEGTGEEIIESVEHYEEQRNGSHKEKQLSKAELAKEFAIGLLTDGRVIPVTEFDEMAKNKGISVRTWTETKKELGIVSGRVSMNGPWIVRLPPNSIFLSPCVGSGKE